MSHLASGKEKTVTRKLKFWIIDYNQNYKNDKNFQLFGSENPNVLPLTGH